MPRNKVCLAMFDVRPTGGTEGFGFEEIEPEINLQEQTGGIQLEFDARQTDVFDPEQAEPILRHRKSQGLAMAGGPPDTKYKILNTNLVPKVEIDEDLFYKLPKPSSKKYILEELERVLAEPVNAITDLESYGGQVHEDKKPKPRTRVLEPKKLILGHRNPALSVGAQRVVGTKLSTEKFASSFGKGGVAMSEEFEKVGEPILRLAMSQPGEQSPDIMSSNVRRTFDDINQRSNLATSQVARSEIDVHSPASREIEVWLDNLKKNQPTSSNPALERERRPPAARLKRFFLKGGTRFNSWFKRNRYYSIIFLAICGLVFNFIYQNGVGARQNIVQNGGNAVANLEKAKKDLEEFKFVEAADRFALAYDDFNRASGTLSQMGASFLSVFGPASWRVPGLGKIKAASNLVEAGQSISKAGENLSLAFGTLYKTNLLSFLDSSGEGSFKSISKILTEFRDVLIFAEKNIVRADSLLANIDASVLPLDKQPMFLDFKEKIPDFQKYIGDAVDYSEFLLDVVGVSGAKTYLVLLQNNSELRPTGGFPGTYAVVTFEDGSLKKIFVDDIYRLDAALKENIVPPKPLQHITPNWGLRDANWWANFPISARKIAQFYKLDTGQEIDGILTVTPTVIERIFNVIGPVEMPEYGTTLDANNFLHEIQNEVEYEADRSVPKQIVSDLQPLFFERLSQQDKSKWVEIFKVLLEAVEQKHVLAYFNNDKLEEVVLKNGLGGEAKQAAGDYLQVAFSNVKGSKTDFVTDNILNLDVAIKNDNTINHVLKITRAHNGGNSKYGFYNRDNSAYVKVYVPSGSKLASIQGNSITDYKPLIGHADFGFKVDPDLARIENSTSHPFPDVDVFEESGKAVFGFWLIVKPGSTKTVILSYSSSVDMSLGGYKLYWQKQAGTIDDRINFSFALPKGRQAVNQSEDFQLLGNNLVLNSDLLVDREVDIGFR